MIEKKKKFFKKLKKKNHYKYSTYSNPIGDFAIQSCENGFLTEKQIEVIKFFFKRKLKKKCSIFFINKPNFPYTKRPKGVRMGAGKSKIYKVIYPILKGRLLFTLKKKKSVNIKYICKQLNYRLNFKVRYISLSTSLPKSL